MRSATDDVDPAYQYRDDLICGYIEWYLETHRYAPSVREIGGYLGLQSTSTTMEHLNGARRRGRITWLSAQPRTITVVTHT